MRTFRLANLARSDEAGRLLRFIVVGGIAAMAYAGTSTLLSSIWPEHRPLIGILVYLSFVPPTYLVQKQLARRGSGGALAGFIRYCAVQLCSVTLASILVALLASSDATWNFIVYVGSAACSACLNLVLCHLLVFRTGCEGGDEMKFAADRQA